MTFRDMVISTNSAFLSAFGEPVTFVYGTETIPSSGIVNIVDRVPWLEDGQDQTVTDTIDFDPPGVSWLTDELAQYWQITARGITYAIAGVERNEMTTLRLRDIIPEDIDADQGY
jgi:hypothetical protein